METILMLSAGGVASRNVVKCIRQVVPDVRIVGIDAEGFDYRMDLSSSDVRLTIPRVTADPHDWEVGLRNAIDVYKPILVMAQSDPEVRRLADITHSIASQVVMPPASVISLCQNKLGLAASLERYGLLVPQSRPIHFGFKGRWLVRPIKGAGAQNYVIVNSDDELNYWLRFLKREHALFESHLMMSEFISGDDLGWQSLWLDGRLVASFLRRRTTYAFGGLSIFGLASSASVSETETDYNVHEACLTAVRTVDLNPHGVYCIDGRRTNDAFYITEINAGRFFTTCDFPAALGLNMPGMIVQHAMGKKVHEERQVPGSFRWLRSMDAPPVLSRLRG